MANESRNHTRRKENLKTNYYIDGNTVRRLEGEPEERRQRALEKERAKKRRQNRRAAKRNQEREQRINLGYVAFCSTAVILLGVVCGAYIHFQSDIINKTKVISSLESQIVDLRADNDAALKRIELSTDLDAIKEQALSFGMKYAAPEQIFYYSVQDNDYMNQYSDIPDSE